MRCKRRRPRGRSVQHTVRLRGFSHLLRLSLPRRGTSTRVFTRMTVDVDSLAGAKRSCQRGRQHRGDDGRYRRTAAMFTT